MSPQVLSLEQALQGFIIHLKASSYSPNTVDLYTWALDKLKTFTENAKITEISQNTLSQFMVLQYDSGLAPASIDNLWKSLRTFFKWASEELGIARPDLQLKRPRYAPTPIQPFTEDEIKALLKATEHTKPAATTRRTSWQQARPTHLRDKALVLVLLDTGIRVGELCRLKISDLNESNGELSISPYTTGRKSKGRTVYAGSAARKAIWRYLVSRTDTKINDPLFANGNKFMDRFSVKKLMSRLGTRAGVVGCHPHRFRHTFAIQYLRNGGDVFTLQRLLGHSTLEMTRRYLALASVDDQAVHRRASPVDNWRL